MRQRIGRVQHALFALAMVAALGFGATRALADTGAAKTAARACNLSQCNSACRANCPPGQICRGMCDPVDGCICYNP